jgi:hypothetical protein
LEFAKTESTVTIVMVEWKFHTKYRTEPLTDKTIREWYKKFQQTGCLCAVKRTGQPEPSAKTVERAQSVSFRVKKFAQNLD